MGGAVHVLEGMVGAHDLAGAPRIDEVLRLALAEVTLPRRDRKQHVAPQLGGFGLVRHEPPPVAIYPMDRL